MAQTPHPQLVPLKDKKKHYQIIKQTFIPPQFFIGEDDVVSTLPIFFVFVQEVESPPSDAEPPESS